MTDTQLLETIVEAIVAEPNAILITRSVDEQGVLLSLQVAQDDMGKVIGRTGKTITGIRAVMRAAGMKQGSRVNVKVLEVDGTDGRGESASNGYGV